MPQVYILKLDKELGFFHSFLGKQGIIFIWDCLILVILQYSNTLMMANCKKLLSAALKS